MTVVAVTGPAGGLGVSTVAAALASTWPDQCVLVECDPSGGDIGAWWDLPASPALASAVAAAPTDWMSIAEHAQPVGAVQVLAAPVRTGEAAVTVASAVQRLLPILAGSTEIDAIVDAGRCGPALPAALAQAALTVVVARQVPGSTRATAAILDRTADVLALCAQRAIPTVVAMAGSDPYPAGEIARYLDVEVFAIADDRLGAAVLAGRPATGRLATRSRLLRSTRLLATAVHHQLASLTAVTR